MVIKKVQESEKRMEFVISFGVVAAFEEKRQLKTYDDY